MPHAPSPYRRRLALLLACTAAAPAWAGRPAEEVDPSALLAAATPAASVAPATRASTDAPGAPAAPSPSQNVTINLINRLVERGVLPKDDAAELIQQAEADTVAARAHAAQVAPPPAPDEVAAGPNEPPLFPDAQVVPTPTAVPDDTVRVTYIPEIVKAQMRDEILAELRQEARAGTLAYNVNRTPSTGAPLFRVAGDVRIRYQSDTFGVGNDNTGTFPNFNAINTGSPYDVSGTVFSPQLNVDQDRQRFRLRARLGTEINLGDGFTAGLRLATGESNSPVSANQSFGLANQAQGGNFSKYAIWLDRAYLKYQLGGKPEADLSLAGGRTDNPFFATTVLWANDLGFDGAVLHGHRQFFNRVTPFLTAGAFAVFNTDLNFSSIQPAKFSSDDKYLYAAQAGFDLKIVKDLNVKLAGAYYYFENIEGRLSDPYTPLTAQDAGNTDNTRPAFAQKGNTYRPLRNIVPNANNNFGTSQQFQYFGLATPFHELAFTGRIDYSRFEPFQVSLLGEYVKNLAFDGDGINQIAVNNRGTDSSLGAIGAYAGGDTAWTLDLRVGRPALEKRWDWYAGLGYRHVESDAVVDGFTDSDFGGGGTNLEGYTVSAALALSPHISLGLRWMSANEIAGPPLKTDILQVDLNGKF